MPPPPTPRRILKDATAALKEGRLHPDQWAVIDDLLLDDLVEEAAAHLAQHVACSPIYLGVFGA